MIDKNTIGLIETQIAEIKQSSGKELNNLMLETVKLLLENVEASNELISSYDKFEIRELFAEYTSIGEKITGFFYETKDKLEPKALSEGLTKRIDMTTSKIKETKRAPRCSEWVKWD